MKSVRRKENEDEVLSGIYMKYCVCSVIGRITRSQSALWRTLQHPVREIVNAAPFFGFPSQMRPCFHSVRGRGRNSIDGVGIRYWFGRGGTDGVGIRYWFGWLCIGGVGTGYWFGQDSIEVGIRVLVWAGIALVCWVCIGLGRDSTVEMGMPGRQHGSYDEGGAMVGDSTGGVTRRVQCTGG